MISPGIDTEDCHYPGRLVQFPALTPFSTTIFRSNSAAKAKAVHNSSSFSALEMPTLNLN